MKYVHFVGILLFFTVIFLNRGLWAFKKAF